MDRSLTALLQSRLEHCTLAGAGVRYKSAGKLKRNPGRHDRKEEFRMTQMDRPGEEEERGEEQADEGAENQSRER